MERRRTSAGDRPHAVAARGASDRLFFAVHPDAHTAQRIVELTRALRGRAGLRGSPLPAARLHVTLHHLGDYRGLPQAVIDAAAGAAAQVAMPPFAIRFDRVGSFTSRARKRPCVLLGESEDANRALCELQNQLAARLRAAGLAPRTEGRFTPHLTLCYDERGLAAEAVAPVEWTVQRFALVHSLIGRGEHRVLAAWSLET